MKNKYKYYLWGGFFRGVRLKIHIFSDGECDFVTVEIYLYGKKQIQSIRAVEQQMYLAGGNTFGKGIRLFWSKCVWYKEDATVSFQRGL